MLIGKLEHNIFHAPEVAMVLPFDPDGNAPDNTRVMPLACRTSFSLSINLVGGKHGLVGGAERRSCASRKTKKTPYGDFVFDVKCGIASGLTCFMYNTFSLKPSRRAGKSIAFQFVVSGKEKYAMFKGYRTTKKCPSA